MIRPTVKFSRNTWNETLFDIVLYRDALFMSVGKYQVSVHFR